MRARSVTLLLLVACQEPSNKLPEPRDSRGESSRPTGDSDLHSDPGAPLPAVRINEVLSDNHAGLTDGDGDTEDWIELWNHGDEDVELGGWGLSDDPDEPYAWVFPTVTLAAGEYRVIFASGKGEDGPASELHTSFRLDRSGERLSLTAADGRQIDAVELPELPEDLSWGIAQPITELRPLTEAWASVSAPGDGWDEVGGSDAGFSTIGLPAGYDGRGGTGTPENVALFRPTTQTSDGYGYTGAEATDGELSTFSHTGDADLSPTWEVDLGGTFSVDSIELFNRVGCCPERLYNLTVEVEDAGVVVYRSELLNPTLEGQAPVSPGDSIRLDAGAERWTGDTVRVQKQAVNGALSSEWLSMAEVVVSGVPGAPYGSQLVGLLPEGVSPVYLRLPFSGAEADRARIELRVDDGVVVSLDGVELGRLHVDPAGLVEDHEAEGTETLSIDPGLVGPGDHMLGLEVQSVDPDDLLIDVALVLEQVGEGNEAYFVVPTPGAPNGSGYDGLVQAPEADPPRGFYDTPTVVTLRSPTPGATLRYTLDGSDPAGGTEVIPAAGASAEVTLSVSANTLLRADATLDGWSPSETVTHTYLFLEQVIRQPAAPAGWPTEWYDPAQGSFAANYEMDPEVVDDPAYHDDLLAGLREIPTLSLVFEQDDVFGADGIYVRSLERGDTAEAPVSVELILPDGSTGFAENAGLRLHGYGWRYHSATLKHALRLEFKGAYGARKLEYPLFPDSPATRFDNIVLRAQGSRGFQDFRDPEQACYLRDSFARDTARDMGKLDGHATYVHLYLNGLYWGLYNPVERPDAGFAEEYLGGDADDYDAINRRTSTNEAIDGDLEALNALLALVDQDTTQADVYAEIQQYLSIDALIDYMLIHQYTVNRDGPCCYDSNNMRAIRLRAPGAPFYFMVWDMEYSIWEATDDTNVNIDVPGSASHIYTRLRENPDFRARYAELAALHLGPGGALSPEEAAARWLGRADEIRNAIVAESARWGDTTREPPYTRDAEWDEEQRRILEEFFPYRSSLLADQLRAEGLMLPE